MSLITIPNTFTVGATIVASQHNSNFSTIYSDYNGNITDANISASASIADTKLAQISTVSKVSGAALTLLTSVVSGAGALPLLNMSSACVVITTSYNMATASGTVTITGVGFTPSKVMVLSEVAGTTAMSVGIDDGTTAFAVYDDSNAGTGANSWGFSNASIALQTTGGATQSGHFSSFNSDGGVISFIKTASPVGTARIGFLFFK